MFRMTRPPKRRVGGKSTTLSKFFHSAPSCAIAMAYVGLFAWGWLQG
jgi:hypothetical protein